MDPEQIVDELNAGTLLAAEIPSRDERRRAWVGVHPFKWDAFAGRPENADTLPYKFRVTVFEIDRGFDYNAYDLHPEYIIQGLDQVVLCAEDVIELLRQHGVDVSRLGYGRNCDYPL